jgi:hypothetical protein
MMETMRNLHQLLKGKHLYSALYGVYTEMLPDLTAVLKASSAKGETAKTTINESPSKREIPRTEKMKVEAFKQCQQKNKKPATFTVGVNEPQMQMKGAVPPGTSSSLLCQLKWRLTTVMIQMTPPRVSNIKRHPAW